MTFMEEIGRGAYGKVYKGVLTELAGVEVFFKPKEERVEISEGRIVAVKTLLGNNFNHIRSRTSHTFTHLSRFCLGQSISSGVHNELILTRAVL